MLFFNCLLASSSQSQYVLDNGGAAEEEATAADREKNSFNSLIYESIFAWSLNTDPVIQYYYYRLDYYYSFGQSSLHWLTTTRQYFDK